MKPIINIQNQMKISTLHKRMEDMRIEGEPITLRQFLKLEFPEYFSHNLDLQLEKYYSDMGIDFRKTTVSNMIDLADDNNEFKWLWYETLLSAIHTAVYIDPLHLLLIAYSHSEKSKTITLPIIKTEDIKASHKKGKEVAAGGEFEEDTIKVTDKTKQFQKFGKTLKIPYETIYDCALPVLAEFLKGYMGVIWTGKLDMVLDCIINGDNAKTSKEETVDSSCAEIGVDNTEAGIQFKDIKRACIRLSRLKRPADIMVGNEEMINDVTELDEFKKRFEGVPLHMLTINGFKSLPDNAIISDEMDTGKLLFLSKLHCVAEFIKQALMIENDKIISKQLIVIAISEYITYMNLFRDAKVMLDGSVTFASQGFPGYMELTKPK